MGKAAAASAGKDLALHLAGTARVFSAGMLGEVGAVSELAPSTFNTQDVFKCSSPL